MLPISKRLALCYYKQIIGLQTCCQWFSVWAR